jgi:phage terminase large subunit
MSKVQIDISDKYQPLFKGKNRLYILTGGRASGKSFIGAIFALFLSMEAGHVILYTRYTMTSAEISIIPEFLKKIELLNWQKYFYVVKNEIVNKISGSRILFRGIKTSSGDQTANLKSIEGLTTWIFEEAEELRSRETFDKINYSIRVEGVTNRVVLILNNTDEEHFIYKDFFSPKLKDVVYIHTTYLDNINNLSKSFVQDVEKLKETNYEAYYHIILGNFRKTAKGIIFKNISRYTQDVKGLKVYGLDFGFSNDPTALIETTITKEGYYFKQLIYETGLTNTDLIKILKTLNIKYAPIYADSSRPDSIEEIFRAGFNIHKANKAIKYGIDCMLDRPIYLHENSLELIKEFNTYSWQTDRNGNQLPEPIDYLNHAIDAARYSVATAQIKPEATNAISKIKRPIPRRERYV